MARMKIEFLHADRKKNGWSLKDRLVARLPDYAATRSPLCRLLNLRNKSSVLAAIGEKAAWLFARRSLPGMAEPALLQQRHGRREPRRGAGAARPVVLVRRHLQWLLRIRQRAGRA
jgi:hypothetical protein